MSGTETILLIVLGFALATLIALFMGRMVWTAAVKVGARRMQRQVPSSLVGLQTERDRLRAEYAMMAQRLGTRLEEAKLRLAEATAEVSRHRNRLHEVEVSETARLAEMRQLQGKVKELEFALSDSKASEGELRHALAAKEEALRKLRKKKGYEGYKFPEEPAAAPPLDPELRLRQRIDKLSELARSKPAEQSVAEKLSEAERQTRELERELQRLESEWVPSEPTPDPPESGNVILLPNRNRDLKTGTTPAS
jgi:chromosome segregation ATPase